MKVLIITPSYFPIIGGSETLARSLVVKLNASGIQTDILTLNMDKKWSPVWSEKFEDNGSFKVFRMPALNPFSLFPINPLYYSLRINVLPKLGFVKKFKDYDIIHFLGEADLSFPIFSFSVQKPKIMHCVALQSLNTQYKRHPLLKKLFLRVFPQLADLYIVLSSDERKILLDLGVSPRRILELPYATDTQIFRPNEKKKLDNLILFAGRIDKTKGLHVLLESLSYLNLKTQVTIIGPHENSEYFEETKKMCHQINKEKVHAVKYLGKMKQNDLIPWYQMATVLVRPDLLEVSGGLTAMEALACGTPVIGTGNHVIKDNVNGIIVPSNNPKKLAKALYKLLVNKELRGKYGREGRRIIEEVFSWKPFLTRLIGVYEEML